MIVQKLVIQFFRQPGDEYFAGRLSLRKEMCLGLAYGIAPGFVNGVTDRTLHLLRIFVTAYLSNLCIDHLIQRCGGIPGEEGNGRS